MDLRALQAETTSFSLRSRPSVAAIVFAAVTTLSACSTEDDSMDVPPGEGPATSFESSVSEADMGISFRLSWDSETAESCSASGAWSGDKAISGSEAIVEMSAGTKTYTLTCTEDGENREQSVSVFIIGPSADATLNSWYGTPVPSYVPEPPETYTLFDNSDGLRTAGQAESLDHEATDSPGAGKFIYNRVYRASKHGLGLNEQFGIFSSWLQSFGANSIEGGLWVNPVASGATYYPTLHLAAIGDAYHVCNDVQMGTGFYGLYLADRWLTLLQVSNQVITVPGSNIAFDMNQNPYDQDNGIWTGFGWTYLNLDHPKEYPFWMSFVETYNYQGPINAYVPEHFNWVDPAKIENGVFEETRRQYGAQFGTLATRGSSANSGTGNESYLRDVLRLEEDLFYTPIPYFPMEKSREFVVAYPQNIKRAAMEDYSRLLKSGNMESPLIPTERLSFNSLYQSSHQRVKIIEDIEGVEHRYYVEPLYEVGFDGELGFVDWDFHDSERYDLAKSSNGYAYVKKLDSKWEVESGASEEIRNHPHSYRTEIVSPPDDTIRAPNKTYRFLSYPERDTSHPDFANWKIDGKTRYESVLQNGTTVTYVWFKFTEQPAMLTAQQNHPETYTDEYLEDLQAHIEKLHALTNTHSVENPETSTFVNKPSTLTPGTMDLHLAKIDEEQIVTPPQGMEVGYVPVIISLEQPEGHSAIELEPISAPSPFCSNSSWTDTYYPDYFE